MQELPQLNPTKLKETVSTGAMGMSATQQITLTYEDYPLAKSFVSTKTLLATLGSSSTLSTCTGTSEMSTSRRMCLESCFCVTYTLTCEASV
eukprot:4547398-Amphidinium_carterae.1